MNSQVAVIGLGLMGGPIASHLVTSGHKVFGWDPSPQARENAANHGVTILESLTNLPNEVSLVFTCLPSASAAWEVANTFASMAVQGMVIAEMSTLSLTDKKRCQHLLQQAQIQMLDCPISGTGAQALTKDLSVYGSGDSHAWTKIENVVASFAMRPRYVGDFGNGTRLKFIANLLVAVHNVATAEALALADSCGLNMSQVVEVIREGAGNSRIFELRGPMMAKRRYIPPTMKQEVWAKDMALIDQFAREVGALTPIFDATQPVYQAALARDSKEDTASVLEFFLPES